MSSEEDEPGEPVYLRLEDALEIYGAIIGAAAAQAADHLRSPDALEGALGRPASYAHYEPADIGLQAAVLAHGIAETQPFVDGNKRTALVAMLTFLEINAAAGEARPCCWQWMTFSGWTPRPLAPCCSRFAV